MARLIPQPLLFLQDANGRPISGAKCTTYVSQTTSPVVTYQDHLLTIPHSNPVTAANNGFFPAIYYPAGVDIKLILRDPLGTVPDQTIDPASPFILTKQEVGQAFYPLDDVEEAASVTPSDYGYPPYTPRRYGAVGNGIADDFNAIQTADTLGASAGVAVMFDSGVYMVDCSANGTALAQTASWIAAPGAAVTIRRKDFTATTAYFTMEQTGRTGLSLDGIDFDGQITTAASSVANQDLGAAGSYSDTTDESLWRKPYGVRLWNANRALVRNCTFRNFLRAGLWIEGDGLSATTPAISKNVMVSNCNVLRTRSGSGGDAFYVGGATDVKFVNCHAYDFQRIGFVCELARTDAETNCRNIEFVNCTADFGHDVVAPESNVGFWVETGDNISFLNCTAQNVAVGYVCGTNINDDTGTTRPWTASIKYTNCVGLREKMGMRIAMGGTRDVHVNVDNCFFEADQLSPSYAGESMGLRAGILIQCNEVRAGVNFRIDIVGTKIHALNQSSGSASNGYGNIRMAQGTVVSAQQLMVNIRDCQFQWTKTDGTDDVAAKTDYQSVTNGYFGDIIFSGANDTNPDGRWKGHANISNCHNHSFGYVLFSSEIQSSLSNVNVSDCRISMRKASLSNNGILRLRDCPLVDFRGDVGWHEIRATNCEFADANTSSKDRTSIASGIFHATGCKFTRQLWLNANGGTTAARPLRLMASSCEWYLPFDTEAGFKATLADSTFAQFQMSGCTFRNNGTGAIGSTDKMIHIVTATGTPQFYGSGNGFDALVVSGGGHVIEYNSTPTYNDAPQTVAAPFLDVFGRQVTFSAV